MDKTLNILILEHSDLARKEIVDAILEFKVECRNRGSFKHVTFYFAHDIPDALKFVDMRRPEAIIANPYLKVDNEGNILVSADISGANGLNDFMLPAMARLYPHIMVGIDNPIYDKQIASIYAAHGIILADEQDLKVHIKNALNMLEKE